MLAGITPLGERSRGRSWPCTVVAFVVGATAAGCVAGAVLGGLGALLGIGGVSLTGRAVLLLAAAVLGAAADFETLRLRVPTLRRQVNAGWMTAYRGWVYGAAFGVQLGLGLTTVVTGSATLVCMAFAVATANPSDGAVVVGAFGLVRGLSVLPAGWVRRPAQLARLSRALDRWERRVGRAVALAQVIVAVVVTAIIVT